MASNIHQLFGRNTGKGDAPAKSRIYINAVGKIISVRRSIYVNKRLARDLGVNPGQHSTYIYSFPQSLDLVPELGEDRYHKTDDAGKRLTDEERKKVVRWFAEFKRAQVDKDALALREVHDYEKQPVDPGDASLDAADAMKSYQRQLHLIARSLDLVEAGAREGLCKAITPKEAERLYQGWQRIYRRLERMGYTQGMFDAQLQVSRRGSPDVHSDLLRAIRKHKDIDEWRHLVAKKNS